MRVERTSIAYPTPKQRCWRLDDHTLPILVANPIWLQWIAGLKDMVGERDPMETARFLLGDRMQYLNVTWWTEQQAKSAIYANMGGGIPPRVLEVILDAAGFATPQE